MIAFEVFLNGEKVCVAGLADMGTFSASVGFHKLLAKRSVDSRDDDRILKSGVDLYVGGIDGQDGDHVGWVSRGLSKDDEVRIRIVEVTEFDPPTRHTPKAEVEANMRLLSNGPKPTPWWKFW